MIGGNGGRQPVVSFWPAIIAFLGYYPSNGLETLGEVALMARLDTGLGQTRLAKKLGIDHHKLRNWEHSKDCPHEEQIRQVEEILLHG